MQFNFNVNDVLKNEIEIIDQNSKLDYYHYNVDAKSVNTLQNSQKLSYIIDAMGTASKLAQNLPKVITTSSKLKNSDQKVYLLKDESSNNGNGEVVGLLKIGIKKLFVYDMQGNQHETKPLCVLDFYIHESKQRQGFGKSIFEFMLKSENAEPQNLAIDRPSSKFLSFLAKHYNLTDPVPQANNFVLFMSFFSDGSNMPKKSRNRGYPYSMQTPTPGAGSHQRKMPPPQSPAPTVEPKKTVVAPQSQPRVRPVSCSNKDKMGLLCDKTSIQSMSPCPDPPLLSREVNIQSYRWYLDPNQLASAQNSNSNNRKLHYNNYDKLPNSSLPKIQHKSIDNLYSCHNAARGPSVAGCDMKQPMKVGNKTHSKGDYNYSQGLARHYSHTRIW